MKHLLLATLLFPTLLLAQTMPRALPRPAVPNAPQLDVLPDNYQITLIVADKDQPPVEVSVVVASSVFVTSLAEPSLNFSGSMTIEDSGAIFVTYTLGWETKMTVNNNIQYQASNMQGSIRLKPGEEVEVIRAATRTARLSIKKLAPAKPK